MSLPWHSSSSGQHDSCTQNAPGQHRGHTWPGPLCSETCRGGCSGTLGSQRPNKNTGEISIRGMFSREQIFFFFKWGGTSWIFQKKKYNNCKVFCNGALRTTTQLGWELLHWNSIFKQSNDYFCERFTLVIFPPLKLANLLRDRVRTLDVRWTVNRFVAGTFFLHLIKCKCVVYKTSITLMWALCTSTISVC